MTDAERCPACGTDRLQRTRVSQEVAAASIAVHGEGLTVRHCACDHLEVPAELGRAARRASAEALPAARVRWLRPDRCRSCARPLTMPARRTTRAVTVTTETLPIVTLRCDVPMTRCPGCGLDQLPSRARHDVAVALATLLQAAADEVSGEDQVDVDDLGPLERFTHRLRRSRGRPRRPGR